LRGSAENFEEVRNKKAGENERGDNPRGKTLDEPIDLPRPSLDASEGDEIGSRGKAADPVVDDADEWIWSQRGLVQ
jgi:hypothetical protein